MKIFFIFLVYIQILFVQVINCIILNEIDVPELVKIEKDDDNDNEMAPIKLDCNYELVNEPSYLVVKWFMNDNSIYQWIRGQKPSVLPYFKHHIGEIKSTSTDENYEYRGLTLVNPSIELSGTYKCLVQTEHGSRAMEKQLHVVDISNSTIVFDNHPMQNETYLECSVSNIFPRPRIHLVSTDENIVLSSNETRIEKLSNNYYDASMTAIAQNSDDDSDDFFCFVTFDGLNLNFTANTVRSGVCRNSISYNYIWPATVVIALSSKLINLLF